MTKKRILYVIGSFIIIVLAVIAGLVGYLQLSLFEVEPIEKNALSNYINNQNDNNLNRVQDNLYEGEVPMKIVNDELTYRFIEQEKIEGRDIVSGNINLSKGFAKINYSVGIFYVPVYCDVTAEVVDGGYKVIIQSVSYGNKQLNLPEFIDNSVLGNLFETPKEIQLNITDFTPSAFFIYRKSTYDDQVLKAIFTLELPNLDGLVLLVKNDLDEGFVDVYKNGNEAQKEAVEWIESYSDFSEEITSKIFEDYLNKGNVLKELLALSKPGTLLEIYHEYPQLEDVASKEEVITKRGKLIGDFIKGYGQVILEALKDLSGQGNLVVSKSYPFDLENMKTITIDSLVADYELDINEDILESMSLSYVQGQVYIVYTSNEGPYIAISLSGYKTISEEDYNNLYNIDIPSEGTLEQDVDVYEEIYYALFKYYGEDVFIRYLKNDESEAYAIVSKESDYQEYTIVVLRRSGEGFEVLSDGFETAIEVNKAYPDFNMNLATRMNEKTKILVLNSKTKSNIIDGLKDKGLLEEGEEMIYCSYDGIKYISIALNSQERYIYTIYRGAFLEDAYTIEEALKRFDDIDPMILLQPNPNFDMTNE